MSYECQFCKNILKTKSALYSHQKTAKYCLKLRGETNNIYTCKYCNKNLSKKETFDLHSFNCQEKKSKIKDVKIQTQKEEYEAKFEEYEAKLKAQKEEYEAKLKAQKEEYELKLIKKRIEIDNTKHYYQTEIKHIYENIINKQFEAQNNSNIKPQSQVFKDKLVDTKETEVTKTDLSGTITLNSVIIYSRADGMINATALCKAGGKEFSNWYKLERTKALINELESEILRSQNLNLNKTENNVLLIRRTKIIDIKQAGDAKTQGSWIHPRLATNLAGWLSPKFELQVGSWIWELALTGSVKLGSEKTEAQLLQLQNDYNLLHDDHKSLTVKHNNLLHRRSCYKFQEGISFYIVEKENNTYKIGITKDINERLRNYRTLEGQSKLRYLVYSNKSRLIEDMLLSRFEFYKEQKNHEVLTGLELSQIIEAVNSSIDLCKFPSNIVTQEQLDEYNISIDTSDKF